MYFNNNKKTKQQPILLIEKYLLYERFETWLEMYSRSSGSNEESICSSMPIVLCGIHFDGMDESIKD